MTTTTLKFGNGENTFAKHFVVMEKLTGLNIGLPFMKQNSVLIDTTHRLIYFPQLTVKVERVNTQKMQNSKRFSATTNWQFPDDHKSSQYIFLPPILRENNGYCGTTGKFHRNGKIVHFPLNVNKYWQKNSSHSNQHNWINLHNQKEYTDSRVHRSDSGTIHILKAVIVANLNIIPGGHANLTAYLNELPRRKKTQNSKSAQSGFSHPKMQAKLRIVLRKIHGVFGKQLGITKTLIAYRQKYYYPHMG